MSGPAPWPRVVLTSNPSPVGYDPDFDDEINPPFAAVTRARPPPPPPPAARRGSSTTDDDPDSDPPLRRPAKRQTPSLAPTAHCGVGPLVAACGADGLARTLPAINQGHTHGDGRGCLLTLGPQQDAMATYDFAVSCGYAQLELWVGKTPDLADLRFEHNAVCHSDVESLLALCSDLTARLVEIVAPSSRDDRAKDAEDAENEPVGTVIIVDDTDGDFARLLAHMSAYLLDVLALKDYRLVNVGNCMRRSVKRPVDARFQRFLDGLKPATRLRSELTFKSRARDLWLARVM